MDVLNGLVLLGKLIRFRRNLSFDMINVVILHKL